jgi:hypothetical protein
METSNRETAQDTAPDGVTVALFPRRLKRQADAEFFFGNYLELWRIGASGAITWYMVGLAVSWVAYLLAGMEAAEFAIDYLATPFALWFAAMGIVALLTKGMVAADVTPGGVGLAWGPLGFRKRVFLPYDALERVTITRWRREAHGGLKGKMSHDVEGFSPRFILREPIEIADLAQLPKVSEPHSSKKALVASDDGRELWMYRRLKGGYGDFAASIAKYTGVEDDLSNEPVVQKWGRSDWVLSAFLCGELAWIGSRFFG